MLGYTYLDTAIPEKLLSTFGGLNKEEREKMLLLTDDEVRNNLDGAITG